MLDLVFKNRRNFYDTFGKDPTKDTVHYMRVERLRQIRIYHDKIKGSCGDSESRADMAGKAYIDDITWNDLEMDDIFFRINHTSSFIGEQVLYHRLHLIDKNNGWNNFEKMADYFTMNRVQRWQVEKKLRNIGKKQTAYYMTKLMEYFEPFNKLQMMFFRILQMTLVLSLIGWVFTASQMLMIIFIVKACTNMVI